MKEIVPLLGLETEYGIIREDLDTSDPVEESMLLLKRCREPGVTGAWSYAREGSHQDLRGFAVGRLAQDAEEDAFCAEDSHRPYSFLEMKCDRALVNGARFYNDHTHPEYSTPECRSLFQLVAHDLAGERIVRDSVRERNRELGGEHLQVFKNNTDYSGHSYGTHDNYLIPRALPFDTLVEELTPFLVTRQLYAGAGKIGSEARKLETFSGLQLSQRADFIECLLSIETMTQRPIINTRDEPHATASRYRRLHLILGDANLSPYATALKVGTTRLVLTLIGAGKLKQAPRLDQPVHDIKNVSRDLSGRTRLRLATGGIVTALEVQEGYLAQAEQHLAGQDPEWDWTLREWNRTLHQLRHAPERLADRIDWAIKRKLFEQFRAAEGVQWDDPWMQSLDLEYHNLDEGRGLFYAAESEGGFGIRPLVATEEIEMARSCPPAGTRAMIRGMCAGREADNIRKIHWTGIEFKNGKIIDLTGVISERDVENVLSKEFFSWK